MMSCSDDYAAPCELRIDEFTEDRLTRVVERGGGFVEQPDGPHIDHQSCKRKPSTLSGRESAERECALRDQTSALQGLIETGAAGGMTIDRALKGEVLERSEFGLPAVLMALIEQTARRERITRSVRRLPSKGFVALP